MGNQQKSTVGSEAFRLTNDDIGLHVDSVRNTRIPGCAMREFETARYRVG
jgi:hypothetical protein